MDELGSRVKYACKERGCEATRKRKMGYKEFCIHSSNMHGGLLLVLEDEEDQGLRDLAGVIRKAKLY